MLDRKDLRFLFKWKLSLGSEDIIPFSKSQSLHIGAVWALLEKVSLNCTDLYVTLKMWLKEEWGHLLDVSLP